MNTPNDSITLRRAHRGNPAGLMRPFIGLRQLAALRYVSRRKTPPTRQEIGAHLGITKVSAHLLVDKLVAAGLVSRRPNEPRGLLVSALGRSVLKTRA